MNSLLFLEFCASAVLSFPIYPNMLNLQATNPNLEISNIPHRLAISGNLTKSAIEEPTSAC